MRTSLLLFFSLGLCMACGPKPATRSPDQGPDGDAVATLMRELTPALQRCVPKGRPFLQVRLTFDGPSRRISDAELLPESQLVCEGESGECGSDDAPEAPSAASKLATLECVRGATVGHATPAFEGSTFHVSFPVRGKRKD